MNKNGHGGNNDGSSDGNGDGGNGDGGLSRLWNLGPSLMTVHVSEPGLGFIGAFDFYWRLFFA